MYFAIPALTCISCSTSYTACVTSLAAACWTQRELTLVCVCAGSHVLDEAERSLHDALCVLQQTVQDSRVIYGGGFPEMQMAKVLCTPPAACQPV